MKTFPEYLYSDLMDGFHWTDMDGVTTHELTILDNMANTGGYNLNLLIVIQLWILFSHSQNAQFLEISWQYVDDFTEFIDRWIKENEL